MRYVMFATVVMLLVLGAVYLSVMIDRIVKTLEETEACLRKRLS